MTSPGWVFTFLRTQEVTMALGALPLIDSLKSGQLRVPEIALSAGLKALRLDGVEVRSCTCAEAGVRVVVEKSVLGVHVPVSINLAVRSIEITPQVQEVTFEVSDLKIVGESWLVRIISALASSLVLSAVSGAIEAGGAGDEGVKVTRLRDGVFVADLSALATVKALREAKVPFVGTPVLGLLPALQVEHVPDAVLLKKR